MSGRCRRRREGAAAALSLSLLLLSVPGDPFSGSGSGPRAAEALAGPRRPPPRPSGSIRPPPPLPDTDDPLSLLGLDPAEYRSAPIGRRDVRRAYRRMAQLYHPDSRGRGDVQSAEEHKRANDDFARINAAYERLTEDLHNGVRPGQGGRGRGRRAGARPSGRPGGYTGGYTYGAGYGASASASAAAYGYGRPFEGYWKDPPPRRRTTGQGFSQDRSRARARTRSGASRSGSGSRTGRSSPPRASSSASSSYPRGSGVEDWRRAETSPWSPEGAGKRAMEWAEEISRIERKNRQSRRAEGRGGSFGGRGRNRDIDGGSGERERAGYWGEKEEDRPPVYKNEASIDVRPRIRNTDLAVQEAEREQQALELNYLEGKDRERQLQEDPVHCRVGIQPFNRLKHLRWRRVAGEVITKAGHPDPSTGFFLVGDVDGAGGIITNPQHRQARRSPRLGQTPFDQGLKTMLHIPCQHLAVQTQGHGIPMHSLQHAL